MTAITRDEVMTACMQIDAFTFGVSPKPLPRGVAEEAIRMLNELFCAVQMAAPTAKPTIDEDQSERVLRLVCAMIVNERFGFSDSAINVAVKSAEKIDRLIAEGASRVRL